jgi:hypothetical protein
MRVAPSEALAGVPISGRLLGVNGSLFVRWRLG